MRVLTHLTVSKVTKENGATEVVPGSHIWDDQRKPVYPEEVTYAEMEPGDGVFILGNCYHAAGANITEDSFRTNIVNLFCKGVYRSEENQFLAVDKETAEKLPYDVQDLIGWKASAPFCGWHDLSNPSDLIRENVGLNKDLF